MPYRKSSKLKTDKFSRGCRNALPSYVRGKNASLSQIPRMGFRTVARCHRCRCNRPIKPVIRWQTDSLAAAIELGYTMLLGDNPCKLTICKKCGKPFYARNPKREFCSLGCRNNYNVQKFRAKK